MSPSNSHVSVGIPGISECDLIWRQVIKVKRSLASPSTTGVPIKRNPTQMHSRKTVWIDGETALWEPGREPGTDLSLTAPEEASQSCDTASFCRSPRSARFVLAA